MAVIALASIGLLAWWMHAFARQRRRRMRSTATLARYREALVVGERKTRRRGNDLALTHPSGALLAMPRGRN